MLTTRFTQLIGCSVPVQQAPIGSLSNPPLAAAVSNAGGLGMMAVYGAPPAEVEDALKMLRNLTTAPIGANFILNFMDPGQVRECVSAAAAARVIEFFYSNPDPSLVAQIHEVGRSRAGRSARAMRLRPLPTRDAISSSLRESGGGDLGRYSQA